MSPEVGMSSAGAAATMRGTSAPAARTGYAEHEPQVEHLLVLVRRAVGVASQQRYRDRRRHVLAPGRQRGVTAHPFDHSQDFGRSRPPTFTW